MPFEAAHQMQARPREADPESCARARARLEQRRNELLHDGSPDTRRELARVDEALRWIAAGLYGRCSICCETLELAQIEADPADKSCPRCKKAGLKARRMRGRRPSLRHTPPLRAATPIEPTCCVLSLGDGTEALNRSFLRASRFSQAER